jgi:hypothetical protein
METEVYETVWHGGISGQGHTKGELLPPYNSRSSGCSEVVAELALAQWIAMLEMDPVLKWQGRFGARGNAFQVGRQLYGE